MQFSPALPWDAGTRGTITLREPVTKSDLIKGKLTFINRAGYIYQPGDNDGYVDYFNYSDDTQGLSLAFSIAIGDDEEKNVLEFNAPLDDNIRFIELSKAVGPLESLQLVDENLDPITLGNEGFLIGICPTEDPDLDVKVAISQDGTNIIKAVMVVDEPLAMSKILSRSVPVSINSLLKLSSSPASGAIANLPVLKAEMYSFDNDATIRVMHAPAELQYDGAVGLSLFDSEGNHVYWGDNVTELFVYL